MSRDIDPAVLALYRGAAREEPDGGLDARVLAAAHRPPTPVTPWPLWAEAAAVALMAGLAALNLMRAPQPPSPDDPRYFGFFAGREDKANSAFPCRRRHQKWRPCRNFRFGLRRICTRD